MLRFLLLFGAIANAVSAMTIDDVAKRYVHLVLAMSPHDPDYVDAFYGPGDWKTAAQQEKKSIEQIGAEAAELITQLDLLDSPSPQSSPLGRGGREAPREGQPAPDAAPRDAAPREGGLESLRREYLRKQLGALEARVRILRGEKLSFDEESRALYDAVAPHFDEAHFDQIVRQLEQKIPGDGPLWQRYDNWRKPFVIAKDKLDHVFQLAIAECRKRTLAHIPLPPNESFTVEYVTNKPWGGYNWYKGNYHSVIQVNTELPIYIDRAVDLAAHEGYPGHHVYNALLEKNLVRDRGWPEFTVYALFSPQSLIAEGSANYGREVAFTKAERIQFEKEVLFPAAGIDPARAADYYAVQEMMKQLSFAANEAARQLIDGKIDEAGVEQWLQRYAVMEPPRAKQRVQFIKRYRSYVINYNTGEEMVRRYIESRGGSDNDAEKRWREFTALLSSPRLPEDLK